MCNLNFLVSATISDPESSKIVSFVAPRAELFTGIESRPFCLSVESGPDTPHAVVFTINAR